MTTPTNPILHVPAHKQTSPAAKPGQLTIDEPLNATAAEYYRQVHDPMYQHGVSMTGRMVSSTPNLQQIPQHSPDAARLRNVWVPAVQQDKEQAK